MIDYRHPVREAKKDAPKSKSLKKGETVSLTALARGAK